MSEYSACPIWNTPASIEPRTGLGETVESPRAGGRYFIADRATAILKSRDENQKARLTSWLIEQRRLGADCPKIFSPEVDQMKQRRGLSVHQRADNLLLYIQKQTPNIGETFGYHIDEADPCFYGNASLVRIHEERGGALLSRQLGNPGMVVTRPPGPRVSRVRHNSGGIQISC